jgi:hypothetical protein
MNRDCMIAATLPFLLLASPVARAQQTCTPLRFPAGQTTIVVTGTARTDPPFACYFLTTQADQTASINILSQSPKDDTAFNIEGLVDNQDKYSFRTQNKTYRIDVYLTFARQLPRPFSMQVTVGGAAGRAASSMASGTGGAHFECPASLEGHKALNWNLFDGSRQVPQQLAGDGSGTVVWTIAPAEAARGGVRIRCGSQNTSKVKEFMLGSGIRRCTNAEMSRAFDCN